MAEVIVLVEKSLERVYDNEVKCEGCTEVKLKLSAISVLKGMCGASQGNEVVCFS